MRKIRRGAAIAAHSVAVVAVGALVNEHVMEPMPDQCVREELTACPMVAITESPDDEVAENPEAAAPMQQGTQQLPLIVAQMPAVSALTSLSGGNESAAIAFVQRQARAAQNGAVSADRKSPGNFRMLKRGLVQSYGNRAVYEQ